MRRSWGWFFLWASLAGGQVVPDQYIVELAGEPAATAVARASKGRREAAWERRAQVRAEQGAVRAALAERGIEVLDSLETVANALVVRAGEAQAGELRAVPGVVRVHPVYQVRLLLDRALPLLRVPEAWEQMGGMERAGAGVKIGVIDTGIDSSHPGFQDADLAVPEGFPKVGREEHRKYTNNKIIVARTYENLLGNSNGTPRDEMGHGTAVAMAAAGIRNRGPLAEITGVAPKAWLGNYKVFTATRETTTTAVVLKAMDDAVADGMDVINLSVGTSLTPRPADSISVQAVERAFAAGVLVVAAAGNEGPDPETINSYATAPSALGVGASGSDRFFATAVALEGGGIYPATPSNGPNPEEPISGPLADVAALDQDGLACAALPAGSLEGRIALILRGTCYFEDKLNNAQKAGAAAAVVYTDDRPIAIMSVGSATLPAVMIGNADGLAIKKRLRENPELRATVNFRPGPVPTDPDRLASFSSRGPNPDEAVKPDLVAVGANLYTATQSWYPEGEMYDASGYTAESGTSFSAPLVSGAAAALKSARPGLTPEQYRSLLVNTAAPFPAGAQQPGPVQRVGAGRLDLAAALAGTLAAYPTSLSFGSGGGTFEFTRQLRLANLDSAPDIFTISAEPIGEGPAPSVSANTIELEPGASRSLSVQWAGTALAPGEYQGFLRIRGTRSAAQMRVPYWYAVPTGVPAYLTVLNSRTEGAAGASLRRAIYFRVTDTTGVPVRDVKPEVSVTAGGGEVTDVSLVDSEYPGVFAISVRLGPQAGRNAFRIQVGELIRTVVIQGTQSP